jgi:hypothetical protein
MAGSGRPEAVGKKFPFPSRRALLKELASSRGTHSGGSNLSESAVGRMISLGFSAFLFIVAKDVPFFLYGIPIA